MDYKLPKQTSRPCNRRVTKARHKSCSKGGKVTQLGIGFQKPNIDFQ